MIFCDFFFEKFSQQKKTFFSEMSEKCLKDKIFLDDGYFFVVFSEKTFLVAR